MLANLKHQRVAGQSRPATCRATAGQAKRLAIRATGYSGNGSALYSTAAPLTARAKVLQMLGEGLDMYNGAEQFEPVVKQLISENPTEQPGSMSVALGQGTWQVFYAPHIGRISAAVGARFSPIQYQLVGSGLVSNVKYSAPVVGDGWLSAGGSMARKYDDAVEVTFDRFWVDLGSDSLRADLPPDAAGALFTTDGVVGALGRAAFFPQLAVFPVLYLDSDLAVFKFTPLDSPIAVHKVAP